VDQFSCPPKIHYIAIRLRSEIANKHPFLENNKRVAFATTHTLLLVNDGGVAYAGNTSNPDGQLLGTLMRQQAVGR